MSPSSLFSRLPPLPLSSSNTDAPQIPVFLKTKLSLLPTLSPQEEPLAKIDTTRITQAFPTLTGNASSRAEFSQMISTALKSPFSPRPSVQAEKKQGGKDQEKQGKDQEKKGTQVKAGKGYCPGCSAKLAKGKCSESGIVTSSHIYTIPSKWQQPPPTPYPFPVPPSHNPVSPPSSTPRHLLALIPRTKTKSITRADLGYKLVIITRNHATHPLPFVKKEVVYVQIALYHVEERYIRNPFLCREDEEEGEKEGKVEEEEHLMAFGRGRGVWVGTRFGGLGWAVDLGEDGRKTVLGSGERKGALGWGWMKGGWKWFGKGDGRIALDCGERGCAKSGWKKWWGGKEKRLVLDDGERALLGDEENSLLV